MKIEDIHIYIYIYILWWRAVLMHCTQQHHTRPHKMFLPCDQVWASSMDCLCLQHVPTLVTLPLSIHRCLSHSEAAATTFPFGPAASGILRSAEFSNLQWDERSQPGCMADILRVHDWSYVRSIQHLCASIPDVPSVVGHLDADTAISHGTFRAAQVAAGGICRAVDQVVSGQVRHCRYD